MQLNRAKVGLSNKGDLFVGTAVSLRVLDGRELRSQLDELVFAADVVAKDAQPFLRLRSTGSSATPLSVPPPVTVATPPSPKQRFALLQGKMFLMIDPIKWRQVSSVQPGRMQFANVKGDGYAMVIAERIQAPRDSTSALARIDPGLLARSGPP